MGKEIRKRNAYSSDQEAFEILNESHTDHDNTEHHQRAF
jgi:hypothetical protein